MPDSSTGTGTDTGPPVLQRVVAKPKPRIVLALLLGASFAGVWLSHWADPTIVRAAWWVAVVAAGVLAGGLYWRLRLFDPAAFDDADAMAAVRGRWRRLEAAAVWALAIAAVTALVLGVRDPTSAEPLAFGAAVAAPVLWLALRSFDDNATGGRYALWGVALAALASLAWLETGTGPVDWAVRLGHLSALALWLGGAFWHNGVVLPTLGASPAAAPALKGQARRFRRRLPVAIAVLFLTGAYQTVALLGASLDAVLAAPLGHVVLAKITVLAALTGLVLHGILRGK